MSRYTPGPWAIDNFHPRFCTCSIVSYDNPDSSFGKSIAHILDRNSDNECLPDERLANANLIKAAPELLEALENLVDLIESFSCYKTECITCIKAKKAISRAKGE